MSSDQETRVATLLFRGVGRWWWWFAALALVAPWWNIPRDQADSAGMLAHLHSLFVDGDLLYGNEYERLSMSPLFAFVTRDGVVSNHWPMGATWLQAPGYLLGTVAAKFLRAMGMGKADAMGVVPLLAVRVWALLILGGMIGGVVHWFLPHGRRMAIGVAFALVVGTPLLYYAAEAPLRPHLYGAAITFLLVRSWSRESSEDFASRAIYQGALAGLACCIRPQLALLVLLAWHDAWRSPARGRDLLLATLAFVPWPLLQFVNHVWMYGGGYASHNPVSYHVSQFLFSHYHGALVWCPVLAVGMIAMFRSAMLRERGAWLLLLLVIAQIVINSGYQAIEPEGVIGTRTWGGGVAFGPRKLVDVLPLLLPAVYSLAARRTDGRVPRLVAIAPLLVMITGLLHVAVWLDPSITGAVHTQASMLAALLSPASMQGWAQAFSQRALDVKVALTIVAVVAVPLMLACVSMFAWRERLNERLRLRAAAVALLGLCLLAHAWTAMARVRSDRILREKPVAELAEQRARLLQRHLRVVAEIPAHERDMREILGDDAVGKSR